MTKQSIKKDSRASLAMTKQRNKMKDNLEKRIVKDEQKGQTIESTTDNQKPGELSQDSVINNQESDALNSHAEFSSCHPELVSKSPFVDEYEHIVDIKDPLIRQKIRDCEGLFGEFTGYFLDRLRNFDLSDPDSIDETLKAAKEIDRKSVV